MTYLQQRNQWKLAGKPVAPKKTYKLKPRSAKKIASQKVYALFVAEYLGREENKFCAIRWENCTGEATCINHKKRRFKDTVMNENYIEPSCGNCNSEIENQDERARAEGHLLTKFNLD